jgi:nitrogen fixation protein FixH
MRNSPWRWFPLAVIAGLGAVVLVNVGLMVAALYSFPGKAGSEDFALSNRYDAVLRHAEQEAALGWTVSASADADGVPMVLLSGGDGRPLHGASLEADADRPLGAPEQRHLVFHEAEAGRYVADAVLPARGQWELTISASAEGHRVAATRRVVVR